MANCWQKTKESSKIPNSTTMRVEGSDKRRKIENLVTAEYSEQMADEFEQKVFGDGSVRTLEEDLANAENDKVKYLEVLSRYPGCFQKVPHKWYELIWNIRRVDNPAYKSPFVMCRGCPTLLRNTLGGHIRRHVEKHREPPVINVQYLATPVTKREELYAQPSVSFEQPRRQQVVANVEDRNDVCEAVTNYFIDDAISLDAVDSRAFQQFVRDIARACGTNLDMGKIPIETVLRAKVEERASQLIQRRCQQAVQFIDCGLASIQCDYGMHGNKEYISAHITFMDEVLDEGVVLWKMNRVPLALRQCDGQTKTAESVQDRVVEILEEHDFAKDVASKLFYAADGAANIGAAVGQFRAYISCGTHALHTVGERTFKPSQLSAPHLDEAELEELARINYALEQCDNLVTYIRNDRKMYKRLPRMPRCRVDTRWSSVLSMLEDMLNLLPTLTALPCPLSPDGRNLLHNVARSREALGACFSVLSALNEPILTFQLRNEPNLHFVAPTYFALKAKFDEISVSGSTPQEKLIGKCASLAISQQIRTSLSNVHYCATYLSPEHRKLRTFPQFVKDKIADYLIELHAMVGDLDAPLPRNSPTPNKKRLSFLDTLRDDFIDNDVPPCGVQAEMTIYETLPFHSGPLTIFWPAHRVLLPRLYKMARVLFSLSASQTSCERLFSALDEDGSPQVVEQMLLCREIRKTS